MTQDMYDSQDPSNRLKLNGTEIIPGSIVYVDQNGDNNVTETDRVILGDPNPAFTYGLQTGFSYKNLTLDISFSGSYGNQVINGTRSRLEDVSMATNHTHAAVSQAWTSNNENTNYPRIGYYDFNQVTDRLIEDASYLRIDAITLGYRFNLRKYNKFIDSLVLNASVNNAFVFTHYTGFDPEVDSFTNDSGRIGIDFNSYPRARNIVLGVSLTF